MKKSYAVEWDLNVLNSSPEINKSLFVLITRTTHSKINKESTFYKSLIGSQYCEVRLLLISGCHLIENSLSISEKIIEGDKIINKYLPSIDGEFSLCTLGMLIETSFNQLTERDLIDFPSIYKNAFSFEMDHRDSLTEINLNFADLVKEIPEV